MRTFYMSQFKIAYEQNGVKVAYPKEMENMDTKAYYLIITDPGIAAKKVGMFLSDKQLKKLLDTNFSQQEIRNSILLGERGKFVVEDDPASEHQ